jgi:hypothetical protein
LSAAGKRKRGPLQHESRISIESSSQGSTSSIEGGNDGVDGTRNASACVSAAESRPKKQKQGEPLRMTELKRNWAQLLEECRYHQNALDAGAKRQQWLQKCETIYDEYSTLSKLDFPG